MKPTVNICDGCCCGRVNKSNVWVPIDNDNYVRQGV